MDGCDISNQLTGVFYRTPPPLWNKARKSRFLRLKLSCISGGVGTIQTFYQQHQKYCSKGISYSIWPISYFSVNANPPEVDHPTQLIASIHCTLYIVHLTLDNNLVWAYFKDGQYLNEEYN